VQQVAGEEDGHPVLVTQAAQQVAHFDEALGVQAVGRLIENEQPRVPQQRPGQPEPLLHAMGEGLDPVPLAGGQAHQLQGLVHRPVRGTPLSGGGSYPAG